jgi:hypothetical protein
LGCSFEGGEELIGGVVGDFLQPVGELARQRRIVLGGRRELEHLTQSLRIALRRDVEQRGDHGNLDPHHPTRCPQSDKDIGAWAPVVEDCPNA